MKRKTVFKLIVAILISVLGLIAISYPFACEEHWWLVAFGVIILAIGNALATQHSQNLKKGG